MSDDKDKDGGQGFLFDRGVIEVVKDAEGVRIDRHGSNCSRTREVREALEAGQVPRHPDHPESAKCGPAMVNSEAYRNNWQTIFGKKTTVGQA